MKKRILSLFLVVCLVISSVPNSVFAGGVTYGDVNSDSQINMRDVLAMKRYIAGNGNSIDEIAADVTCDGIIDNADMLLLKQYIAGWDVHLGLPSYNVTFNSNGGAAVDPVSVRQGALISELPSPIKENFVFLGWFTDSELTNQFYAETPVQADLTLYAKYAPVENQQKSADNTFTLIDQLPGLSFNLVSSDLNKNEQAVLAGITLENIGSSDYINLIVSGSNGNFIVTAEGGFIAGASYKLTLDDEALTFADQASSNRICTFTIAKDEVIEITLNDDLKYIQVSELSDIISNGEAVDTLFVALLGNTDTDVTGSFTYAGAGNLLVGDTLCIYTNIKPEDRDTTTDYSDDPIAYVKISGITGTTVSFTSANAEEVLALPDTLPISESELTAYDATGSFTANTSSLDFSSYTQLGLTAQTTVDIGDYLVITENDSDIVYGKVVSVTVNGSSTVVSFTLTTSEEIQGAALDYYTESDIDGNVMIADADVPLLEKQIETQTRQSGFAEDALNYLAYAATQTDSFQNVTGVENFIMTNADGSAVAPGDVNLQKLGATTNSDGITVTAQISTHTQHFGKGLRIAVRVSGEITISAGEENEVVINLSGTFVEEVKMTFNASGGAVWKFWLGFIPYISDYKMNANIDVYDFTAISIEAKITLKEKSIDISAELEKLMNSQDEGEITAGVQNLFEAYGEMIKNDTDYVSLIDKNIFETNSWVDPFCIIAYSFKLDFVVNVNLNLALGCNLEYSSGTRYNFWFSIRAKQAGNSSMDLMDESFHFQFYVMGFLGIRVGLLLEFAVGLFSTKLDSIGITAEAGVYVELFGYFIYQYDSLRAQGSSHTDISSVMCGALYVEFGIYLEIAFKAQVLDGKYKYNPTLYEHQWPLLYAGEQINVYDFGYSQPPDDDIVLIKDVTSLTLPASIRYMDCLDLKEGDLTVNQYGLDKFYYSLSNKNFALNESTGNVTVTVPENIRYMECDLTITWKPAKLAFSSEDLTRTIHLVWTNLTATELQEKHDVCVKVGNNIVWSTRVNHGELPTLPTQAEILALIGYDKYVVNGTNLKYTGYTGYGEQTALPATANQTYTFGVTEREYTLTVNGVQNTNGTTKSLAFTAKFGEKFDLSALAVTGTRIAGTTYTRYLKTDCSSTAGKSVDSTIDTAFATQLRNGTYSYTAKYADNSCNVTYLFYTTDGITIPSVTEILEKGTIPVFDYTDYLINQHEGYIATSWDKTIDKVSADTTFIAACSVPTGEKYAITFDSNNGSSVDPIESYKGAAVSAPAEPVRTGYTFAGWYSNEQLTNAYTFAKMPEYSFMLYAAWTANNYTLTFNANGGACGTSSATVTYGSP
ncbi:MAG: InlB B-repeat-containing protein, partial [Eubacteriales bacterium]